jgi:hypothetical protein
MITMIKQHTKDEYFVKRIRGKNYAVVNKYNMNVCYLAFSKSEANVECSHLNKLNNDYYNL